MSRVHFCSVTNNTHFTDCCEVAICDDESRCPRCKEEVPYTPRQRHNMAMRELYGDAAVDEMRRGWRSQDASQGGRQR